MPSPLVETENLAASQVPTSQSNDAGLPEKQDEAAFDDDQVNNNSEDSELVNLDMDVEGGSSKGRRTTDLVRMYLQEIGRVRLLGRDEEVAEAQKVQKYVILLDLCEQHAERQKIHHYHTKT